MIPQLKKLGLSSSEAKVYLAVLELGQATVLRIAQKARLKRTTVYSNIDALRERGFVRQTKAGRRTVYDAADPQVFLDVLSEQSKVAQLLVPSLRLLAGAIDKKPQVFFFEGREGLKHLYKETLVFPDSKIRAWLSVAAFKEEGRWFDEHYRPSRIKKKIYTLAIVSDTPETRGYREYDTAGFHQTRIDTSDMLRVDSDILIFGGKHVALLSWAEMVGVVIESKRIHDTLQSIFDIHWSMLVGK